MGKSMIFSSSIINDFDHKTRGKDVKQNYAHVGINLSTQIFLFFWISTKILIEPDRSVGKL